MGSIMGCHTFEPVVRKYPLWMLWIALLLTLVTFVSPVDRAQAYATCPDDVGAFGLVAEDPDAKGMLAMFEDFWSGAAVNLRAFILALYGM